MSDDDVRDQLRYEVRRWLDDHWDDQLTVGEWWGRLADSGWGFPMWPTEWCGRGVDARGLDAISDVFREVGAMGAPGGLGQLMGGPVVVEHGTDEQKQRFVRLLAAGREQWCQFFSEPNAGSDLAGTTTRAVRDGDEWVVNGQKVWTSGASTAERGMLLARVDPDAPKHRGLGFFVIDVQQPGIEIRPLRQMTGEAHFNEVFFTDARVADADLIGQAGDGWAAAVTTLAHERSNRGGVVGVASGLGVGVPRAELLERRVADVIADRSTRPALSNGFDRRNPGLSAQTSPLQLARMRGRLDEPVLRDRVMRYYVQFRANELTRLRVKAEADAGRSPGPATSIGKLARSVGSRLNRDLGPEILGADGMLADEDAPIDGAVTLATLHCPASSIAGGTDEVQRNIIGERVLGLPKEPSTDPPRASGDRS